MKSIFPRSCPAIENVFQEAGRPEKVLLVPLDYALRIHTALACNGDGGVLRAAFEVHNNPQGVDFLLETADCLCRRHGILREHVVFGGEDGSAISFNFSHALAARGRLIVGLNAQDAKAERGKLPASTDKIDLHGIAGLLQRRQGRLIQADHSSAAILRRLTRHRNSLVGAHTASAHRIHHLVRQLVPGFLDSKVSGLAPFTEASLWLMSERFSPAQIRARQLPALVAKFEEFNVEKPEETARQLKHLAASVLPPPPSLCESLQFCLSREIEVYRGFEESIARSTRDIAIHLAGTDGATLTTMPGIAIPSAAGLYAELGDSARQRGLAQLSSYGGLVGRLKQSGGPDKEARPVGRSRRANTTLKNLLFLLGRQIDQHGHPELKADYARRVDAGQDVRFTMPRRMLRIVMHMIRAADVFVPPSLRDDPTPEALRAYWIKAWPGILVKWRNAGAIRQAFAPGAILEQWREALNHQHKLKLSNLSPQVDELRKR